MPAMRGAPSVRMATQGHGLLTQRANAGFPSCPRTVVEMALHPSPAIRQAADLGTGPAP